MTSAIFGVLGWYWQSAGVHESVGSAVCLPSRFAAPSPVALAEVPPALRRALQHCLDAMRVEAELEHEEAERTLHALFPAGRAGAPAVSSFSSSSSADAAPSGDAAPLPRLTLRQVRLRTDPLPPLTLTVIRDP